MKHLQSPLFNPDKFEIIVESRHVEDHGETENVTIEDLTIQIHNLSPSALKAREVDFIDIVSDSLEKNFYRKDEDPMFAHSTKSERGPLKKDWQVCGIVIEIVIQFRNLQNQ